MKKRILGILLSLIMAVGMLPTMAMAQETAPAFNLQEDLDGITIPENLVTCICTTTNESKTYGQLPGGFTKYGKVTKKNDIWTVTVRIENSVYLKNFDTDTKEKHSPDSNHPTDFMHPIQFKLKYEGEKWVLDGAMPEDKKLHFTCNGQHAMQEPPTFDLETDLEDIRIPDNLVIVTCETTKQSKNYGAISGGFDTDNAKPYLDVDGVWKVVVQLKLDVYKNQYDAETGATHTVSGIGNTMISFTLEYVHKMWKVKGSFPSVPISVSCNNNHENQPPEIPMYPTIDKISGLNDKIVAVLCANTQDGQEAGKYYGLLNGGFTSTMPTREGDMYESTLTLIPSVYCKQYSTDTGISHTVNPKQTTEGLTFVVKYDEQMKMWMPKEPVKQMGIWVNCEKHETQPQPPNQPMVPTLNNISGLNDKIVAVLCANTQDGQEAGKYYGLLNGGFTSTTPMRAGDMFESTLTLIPSVYCNQYRTDTGITHKVNPNQTTEGLTFVVKYDEKKKVWTPKEEVKPMGIWVNCEKHETQPQPSVTPVYPPNGGGSTIYPGGTPGGNGTIVNPDNNQGDQQPTVDSKDKQGNNKTKKIKKSDTMEKVPKTGDNTGMTIWLVLLLLSVGALFGTVAFDRKRKGI